MKTGSKSTPAKTVDEYFDALPDDVQNTLKKLRKTIQSAAPDAEELISYQIPTYKHNGPVAAFAAFRDHCSFYTMSHSVMESFKDELKAYDTSGVTIHFTPGKPLPDALVKKLVDA
jgi:uncharacterized protein YdhG (YjbR/CyaY superfamily)